MRAISVKADKTKHILAWLVWAVFYGLYSYFVATRVAFHWADFLGFLSIHIASFYFSVRVAFPWANPAWNRLQWRSGLRLALVVLVQLAAIPLLLSVVSIAVNTLAIGFDSRSAPQAHILNFLDVVVFLYSGLVFALVYLGFVKIEAQRDELMAEVEELRVTLSDMETANLEQSLIPHFYGNLLGTVNDAVREQPNDAAYLVNIFNQIVRLYARLKPNELIPIADEIAVAELFVELMEAGRGQKLHVQLEVDEAAHHVKVIPMLILLHWENFDKYAVWDNPDQPIRMYIGMRLGNLIVAVRNAVRDVGATPPRSTKKGLRSIRERLDQRKLPYVMDSHVRQGSFSFALVINFQ